MIDYFILDTSYRKSRVLDQYISMIWHEKYDDVGEFQLMYNEELFKKTGIAIGTRIGNSKTNVVMTVRSITRKHEEHQGFIYTIEGLSLQYILSYRAIFGGSAKPNLKLSGSMGKIICNAVASCFVEGTTYFTYDAIPYFYCLDETNSVEMMRAELQPKGLLETVKELAAIKDMGFEVYPRESGVGYHFRVYHGQYRNYHLSADFDNVQNEQYLLDDYSFKNVAYVWSKDQTKAIAVGYNDISHTRRSGMARRVLNVAADDIDPTDYATNAEFTEALVFRGKTELAKYKHNYVYDVELVDEKLTYVDHFRLGDLMTFRSGTGGYNQVRVVENMWTHDREGFKSHPTFRMWDSEQ